MSMILIFEPKKIIFYEIFLLTDINGVCIMLIMIIEKMRKQIKASGKSLNQIGRETGIDKAALSRIMNGGSCKAETADKLFKYFGLEVKPKKKR